ncbi:LuxR family transcriptional regulator [Rhodobacterales bacterium HKCCE3408]|nr:LuxR family transcriptional regulator [Rhodobacterales bacterium HKCCE3408]
MTVAMAITTTKRTRPKKRRNTWKKRKNTKRSTGIDPEEVGMMARPMVFAVLIAMQLTCASFFVSDILLSVLGVRVQPLPWKLRELMEIGSALGLTLGVGLSSVLLRNSLRRAHAAERALRVASGAFMEFVDERFSEWQLTPAERDVALFTLKGLSLAEIAGLRSTSEGTVKAQGNAIYRKAGVAGRTQLLSLFVEDLMDEDWLATNRNVASCSDVPAGALRRSTDDRVERKPSLPADPQIAAAQRSTALQERVF